MHIEMANVKLNFIAEEITAEKIEEIVAWINKGNVYAWASSESIKISYPAQKIVEAKLGDYVVMVNNVTIVMTKKEFNSIFEEYLY